MELVSGRQSFYRPPLYQLARRGAHVAITVRSKIQ